MPRRLWPKIMDVVVHHPELLHRRHTRGADAEALEPIDLAVLDGEIRGALRLPRVDDNRVVCRVCIPSRGDHEVADCDVVEHCAIEHGPSFIPPGCPWRDALDALNP